MGYEELIRGLVADVLQPQFDSMMVDITHEIFTSSNGRGKDSYSTASPSPRALVDKTAQRHYTSNGVLVQIVATLIFLDPVNIGPDDRLTLPDGTTAPIVDTGGFLDSGTGRAFVTTVKLGNVVRGT